MTGARLSWTHAMAALAVVVLAACGSDEATSTDTPQQNAGDESPVTQSTLVGIEAPTASGGRFDFATTEGQDVLLWFWAPW